MKVLKVSVLVFMFVSSLGASAANLAEREVLAMYLNELTKIEPILLRAEALSGKGERYQFNYKAFKSDTDTIKKGIKDFLNAPTRVPAEINRNPLVFNNPVCTE